MEKILYIPFLFGLWSFPIFSNAEIKCQRGTYLYTNEMNKEVCLLCTPGVNYMHHHWHRNRACFECSKLQDISVEFELAACNRTHDAEIKCKHSHYRSKPKHPGAKEECKKCSECVNPTLPCQDIHDTVCCPGPNYEAVLTKDGVYTCRELCQSGQYFNTSTDLCMTCPLGTYMTDANHTNTACKPCQLPNHYLHQTISKACNSTHPAIFGCENGFFRNRLLEHHRGEVVCLPCRHCQQYQVRACDRYQDTVCCSQLHMIVVDTDDGPECSIPYDTKLTDNISGKSEVVTDISGENKIVIWLILIFIIFGLFCLVAVAVFIFAIPKYRQNFHDNGNLDTLKLKLTITGAMLFYLLTLILLFLIVIYSQSSLCLGFGIVFLVLSASFAIYIQLSTYKRWFTNNYCTLRVSRILSNKNKINIQRKSDSSYSVPLNVPEGEGSALIESNSQDGRSAAQLKTRAETKIDLHLLRKPMNEFKRARIYQNITFALEQGMDINSADEEGKTILMYAADHGQVNVVNVLVNNSADVNLRDRSGNTAIAYAAKNGHDNCVQELITKSSRFNINNQNKDGVTALMLAVSSFSRNVNFPELFIDAGANVHTKDNQGNTALIYAVRRGHFEWVKTLLAAGAEEDVNLKNEDGETATMIAVSSYGDEDKLLHLLIKAGADMNVRDKEHNTLLAIAGGKGNAKCVSTLLNNGLQPYVNTKNNRDLTALMLAVSSSVSNNSCAKELINAGANIDIKDKDNRTALFHAVITRNPEYVELLLIFKANVNDVDRGGKTPLLLAASSTENNSWCVRLLLDSGADVNVEDRDGQTALELAKRAKNDSNIEVISSRFSKKYKNGNGSK